MPSRPAADTSTTVSGPQRPDQPGSSWPANYSAEAEERYRLLAGATNDVLWDWDLVSGRVDRNNALSTTFGHAPAEIQPTREWWDERTHPDDRAGVAALVTDALARQSAFTLEYRFRRGDGTYATILDRAWILRDENGRAVRALGSCVDVSERKALESDLRRKTERLAAMIEMQREIASASFDLADALARISMRAADLAHADGAAIGRVEGEHLVYGASYGVSFPRDRSRFPLETSLASEVIKTREPVIVWDVERDARVHPDVVAGTQIRSLVALPLIAEGRVVGVLSVHGAAPHVFDSEEVQALTLIGGVIAAAIANSARFEENQRLLAERTEALAAVRESEERYRMVTDGTPLRIGFVDADQRYRFVNRSLCQARNLTADQLLGRTLEESMQPVNYAAAKPYVEAALRGEEQLFDVPWLSEAGESRVLACRYVPRRDERGAVIGFFVIASDETDRRRLQEQVQRTQRMEAVGQLAGGIAHDFNNLLTVIGGFADVLGLDARLSHDQRDDIDEIRKATRRASDLTRRLLAFGRKQTMTPRLVDLNAVIRENERMLRRLVQEDVRFEVELREPLGAVFADARQIEHVLVNLVVNARDATPVGGRIMIDTSNVSIGYESNYPVAPGEWVQLRVSDTGSGMTDDVIEHVFEPFFTTKPAGEGTGLGLAMVYGIVEQSGGSIFVDSSKGRGTTFTMLLPRAKRPDEPLQRAVQPAPAETRGERILLVEDEEPVRLLVKRVLERAGYRVVIARNGIEALGVLGREAEPIDLIVSDVVMPEMGGIELVERVRATRPAARVLLMSGYAAAEIERRGGLPAGTHFVQKPFGPDDLTVAVRQALATQVE